MCKHPAAYPDKILAVLRQLVPPGIVLDVFGGIGKIGLLGSEYSAISVELEREWAVQGYDNGCELCIHGDSTSLPFKADSIPCVTTSCAYGNRLSDQYVPAEIKESDRTRRSYRLYLAHPLRQQNGGGMKWGIEYRKLHYRVWQECYRVLQPGGVLVLNCKDFIRTEKGEKLLQPVCNWHGAALKRIGFDWIDIVFIPLKGDQNTNMMRAQGQPTVDYEEISVYRKPDGALDAPSLLLAKSV